MGPGQPDRYQDRRASLRGLKVDVLLKRKKAVERRFHDIEILISGSAFSTEVKKNALAVFRNLFTAEARVHGRKFQEAHLHEAGADDALVDVVGCCFLAEFLEVGAFYCSPLNVGRGWVKTSHGLLSVPPPAVAELVKSIPVYSAGVEEELVTPTGAAIISTLAKKFLTFPQIIYEKIGTGAGSRNFPGFPNVLRAFYGDMKEFGPGKKIYLIEATIDDSNPQVLAHFIETALERGALDAYLAPVVMKKNRLASKLTLLAEMDKLDDLIAAVFKETTSIGVRYFPVERRVLPREIREVKVCGEKIGIKVSYLDGKEINIQPEYEDCLRVARNRGLTLKKVLKLALDGFVTKERQNSKRR